MIYNTQMPLLRMPEYGRTVQKMITHCLSLEDKAERTQCAHAIIKAMATTGPALDATPDAKRKLWDHLAIMSDFKLDIDWPYEPLQAEETKATAEKVPYSNNHITLRHYGHNIEQAVNAIVALPIDNPRKDQMLYLTACQMKKILSSLERDKVEDVRIFRDIADLSRGAIQIAPGTMELPDFKVQDFKPLATKKKKRKRK